MLRSPSPFAKPRTAFLALALTLPIAAQAADAPKQKPAATPTPTASATPNDPVVAKVGATVVHLSDVIQAQRNLPAQYQKAPLQQIYPNLVKELVDQRLFVDAGKAAKVTDDPDYKKTLARETASLQDRLTLQFYAAQVAKKAQNDEALHKLYDAQVKNTPPKDEVHAHHILVATEDEAKAIIAELDKGADFNKLANEKTTDKSGSNNGGDLDWFSKDMMVPEFANAAFALKKGEYTKTPVHTQFGWHVILVDDKRQAPPPTFDELKPQLGNELAQNAIKDEIKKLRDKTKIEMFNPDGSTLPADDAPPADKPATPTLAPAGK